MSRNPGFHFPYKMVTVLMLLVLLLSSYGHGKKRKSRRKATNSIPYIKVDIIADVERSVFNSSQRGSAEGSSSLFLNNTTHSTSSLAASEFPTTSEETSVSESQKETSVSESPKETSVTEVTEEETTVTRPSEKTAVTASSEETIVTGLLKEKGNTKTTLEETVVTGLSEETVNTKATSSEKSGYTETTSSEDSTLPQSSEGTATEGPTPVTAAHIGKESTYIAQHPAIWVCFVLLGLTMILIAVAMYRRAIRQRNTEIERAVLFRKELP